MNTISFTRAIPMSDERRTRFAIEKQFPSVRATGTPNRAEGEAMRRSQAAAIAAPPPMTGPRSAAIVGTRTRSSAESHSSIRRSYRRASSSRVNSANCEMSVPATNALPAPVSTSARTPRSASASRAASARPSYIANVIALRASGRLNVTQTTSPRRSTMRSLTVRSPCGPRRARSRPSRCSRSRPGPPRCAPQGAVRRARCAKATRRAVRVNRAPGRCRDAGAGGR